MKISLKLSLKHPPALNGNINILVFFYGLAILSWFGCKKTTDDTSSTTIISTPHQWLSINSPLMGSNIDIHFTSRDTGFIWGQLGQQYILRTTDGGSSWQTLFSFSRQYPTFTAFYPLNNRVLFASRDTLYKSTDGGISWQKQTSWSGTSVSQIKFVDQIHGFLLTDNKIFATTNSGNNWSLQSNLSGSYNTIIFPDPLHGFLSGGSLIELNGSVNIASVGVLSKTDNAGQNWLKLDTGSYIINKQRFKRITAIDFKDALHGLIAMDDNTLISTADGGLHWDIVNKDLPGYPTQIIYDLNGQVYFIFSNKLYSSANNGSTIGLEFTAPDDLLKLTVTANNQIFAIGRNGKIYKRM